MAKMTVELSEKLDKIVTQLADDQQIPKAAVIRRAVALLGLVEGHQEDGGRIVFRDATGDREIIPL